MANIACQEQIFMPFSALFPVRPRRALLVAFAAIASLGFGPWSPALAAAEAAPPPAGCTGPASKTWLRVIVEGVHDGNGQIAITLYSDDPDRFLAHHGAMYVGRVPAEAGTTNSCIFVPKPGVYVIAIYHDENGNGSFDRNSLGLPAEAYGFSNNPPTLLGLPSFRSVRMNVIHSGLAAHIHLTYP
jgi:uncharacterized protein (DUF2141 family)